MRLNTFALGLVLAMPRFILLLIACGGCGEQGSTSTHDLRATSDLQLEDMSSVPDQANHPLGTRIATGEYGVGAVTTDDFVVAFGGGKGMEAISLTSGMERMITSHFGIETVRERAIFVWSVVLPSTNIFSYSDLTAWTAMTGAVNLSNSSIINIARASFDGAFVFYTDNTDPDGTRTDLVVSRSDGGGAFRFVRRARLSETCIPNARFVQDRLVVNYCPEAADGGTSGHSIVVIDPLTNSFDTLKTGAAFQPFWVDEKSGNVLAAEESGKGWVLSLSGKPPVYVDADVQDGLILPDGSSIVYRTSKNALKRVNPGINPSPITLVPADVRLLFLPQDLPYWQQVIGVNGVFPGVSPDGKKIVFATKLDDGSGFSDLWLASTEAPMAPIPLVTTPTGFMLSRPFTADGSRVFYRKDCTWVLKEDIFFGTLESRDIAGMDLTRVSLFKPPVAAASS